MAKDYRSIGQIYRDMQSGKSIEDGDLRGLEQQMRTVEAKIDEVLEYGSQQAKDQYAKDTPGQTPGIEQEPTHAIHPKVAVDGVPEKGGAIKKPKLDTVAKPLPEAKLDPVGQADADIDNDGDVDSSDKYLKNRRKKISKAIKKDVKEAKKNCGCGKDPCETYGKQEDLDELSSKTLKNYIRKAASPVNKPSAINLASKGGYKLGKSDSHDLDAGEKEDQKAFNRGRGIQKAAKKLYSRTNEENEQLDEYGMVMSNKDACPMCSKKNGKQVLYASCGCEKKEDVQNEMSMSVTLQRRKNNMYKVTGVGDKMKAHGGIKKGEKFHDSEIDGMHDSGIKVKYEKDKKKKQFEFVVPQFSHFVQESSWDGGDPSDATPKAQLEKERSERLKKMNKKPAKPVNEISNATKMSYISKANKEISDKEKAGQNKPDSVMKKDTMKRRMGVRIAKAKLESFDSFAEAGRWDQSSQGRRYRNMSPEEKKRLAQKNRVMKQAKSVYSGENYEYIPLADYTEEDAKYMFEAMSPAERKVAAGKIFQMHQAKMRNKSSMAAKKDAMKASKSYKTSDDSHLDKKSDYQKPKGKRGVSDTPHIVGQLRSVIDNDKHPGVKFKDGSTKKVSQDHAKSWLKKHDSSKPAQRLAMYKHHDSPKAFKQGMSEASAAEVLKKRYASYNPDDNPQATKRIKDHIPGMKTYKMHPGAKLTDKGYSKKGKMAALKKQHERRPEQYGITKEESLDELKISTMDKYKRKAYGDIQTGENARHKGYPEKDIDKRQDKRYKGIDTANKRIAKKQVKMAKGIAFDKRYKGGNMTGASKAIDKIKPGLSDHPKVKGALRRANETVEFNKQLFGQNEAIERRADRKTIIATDPATGRKVVKVAPKKEIDIGKGKMA